MGNRRIKNVDYVLQAYSPNEAVITEPDMFTVKDIKTKQRGVQRITTKDGRKVINIIK